MERGRLISPFGTEYVGLKITVGGVSDPALIERNYEDIKRILHSNQQPYQEIETKTPQGTLKSFTIIT